MTNHYGTPENHKMKNGNHTESDFDYGADFHTFGLEWGDIVLGLLVFIRAKKKS